MLYSPVCIFYFYFYFNDYASLFFFLSVCAKNVKIKKNKYHKSNFVIRQLLLLQCVLHQD